MTPQDKLPMQGIWYNNQRDVSVTELWYVLGDACRDNEPFSI